MGSMKKKRKEGPPHSTNFIMRVPIKKIKAQFIVGQLTFQFKNPCCGSQKFKFKFQNSKFKVQAQNQIKS